MLHHVTFSRPPGKTTAIVGGSGAGKSTLIALLQRFYDLDGSIAIDGQDIASGDQAQSLRKRSPMFRSSPTCLRGRPR